MDDSVPGQLSARLVLLLRGGIGKRAGQGDEGSYAYPGATSSDIPVLLVVGEPRSGNVEVRPWSAVGHEFSEKGGCHQGATPTIGCNRAQIGHL